MVVHNSTQKSIKENLHKKLRDTHISLGYLRHSFSDIFMILMSPDDDMLLRNIDTRFHKESLGFFFSDKKHFFKRLRRRLISGTKWYGI